jgi:hypothetical protein
MRRGRGGGHATYGVENADFVELAEAMANVLTSTTSALPTSALDKDGDQCRVIRAVVACEGGSGIQVNDNGGCGLP